MARTGKQVDSEPCGAGRSPGRLVRDGLDSLNKTPVYTYEPAASAYSGLKSTGRIDLIRDSELKRAIVHYFEDRQPAILRMNAVWVEVWDNWWEAAASHVDLVETDDSIPRPNVAPATGTSPERDRMFLFRTADVDGWSSAFNGYVRELIDLNSALAGQVRAYLRFQE